MKRYEQKLLAYIHRLTKIADDDAQDVLQEVFIKTYENLNDFDQDLKFSSWIYRITYNHTISYYRKNKNNWEDLSLDDSFELLSKIASNLNVKEKVSKKILKDKIKALLQELDEKYRDILILRFLEEKDYEEISNIIKKPIGTVATLLNRAKAKFKQILIDNHIS